MLLFLFVRKVLASLTQRLIFCIHELNNLKDELLNKPLILILVILSSLTMLSLAGCNVLSQEELARLEVPLINDITDPTFTSANLSIHEGDTIYLWTDVDLEFIGKIDMVYLVRITGPQGEINKYEIRPLDEDRRTVTMNNRRITINDRTEWSFSSYYYSFYADQSGEYLFEVTLVVNEISQAAMYTINQSDLVLKR